MKDASIDLNVTPGDFVNIMRALYRLRDDYTDQLADPAQSDVHVMCELKIKEVNDLCGRLEIAYEEG